ncbi:MAG: VanZ family protein [Undibacterium sp.]|nr:VanZ family protein [Opitutaceae bacterium]
MTSVQQSLRGRWVYALAVAGLIVVASSRSALESGIHVANFDKVVHFSVYGLMGTLVVRALGRRRWGWAVAIVSLFGVSDEVHQYFTPGRSMEFADWVADTLGAATAVAGYCGWARYRAWLETGLGSDRTAEKNRA